MATRCDVKISAQERMIEIEAPADRILPGRMIRTIVHNLETKYELYEYCLVRSERQAEEMDDVVATVPLYNASLNKGRAVVIQRLHNSLYDPTYITLEPEQMEEFAQILEPGEELVEEDYTVAMPNDYFVLVTDDIKKFTTVATHLKLQDFDRMRECAARLGAANITIQDEALMTVEYDEEKFPDLMMRGCEEFLRTPVYQSMGDM